MRADSRVAVFPGSFDPITLGHEDIARRALTIADRVIVAVAHSPTQSKRGIFSVTERIEMIREVFSDQPAIEAAEFQGLLVDFVRRAGASLVIRGVRGVIDFEYEFQMALMNRALEPAIETIFLAPDPARSFVSASLVREISGLGGDITPFVSPTVARHLEAKRGG
jgi:pantetheine-phosphate adenylyltransferase